MGRLFAGTPFDRPPRCERCGALESECQCPPLSTTPAPRDPSEQTASVRSEKRPKGKVVTVVLGLDPEPEALSRLATTLKGRCGSGGTVKDGTIEIQGDHIDTVKSALTALGYRLKKR